MLRCVKIAVARPKTTFLYTQIRVTVMPQALSVQPANHQPSSGIAVSLTSEPIVNKAEQVAPHEIPAGDDTTEPFPNFLTSRDPNNGPKSVRGLGSNGPESKIAVTFFPPLMTSSQVNAVPRQTRPDQPENLEPTGALAVNVTAVPRSKLAEQVSPHEIPAGDDTTKPEPVPTFLIDKVAVGAATFAVTEEEVETNEPRTQTNATTTRHSAPDRSVRTLI